MYIYIYFCQRRLRLDLGPLCRWPIRARRRIGDEGRLKNCVCKREREEGWRDAQFDEWLIVPRDYKESRTVCYFFSRVFFLFSDWKFGGEKERKPPWEFLFSNQSSLTFLICKKILKEEGNNSIDRFLSCFYSIHKSERNHQQVKWR